MVHGLFFTITLLSALGAGISAGIYFIFSNTVMDALGKLTPSEGARAMQSINRVIQNPLFFLIFFGTAITSLTLLISLFWSWGQPGSVYLLLGGLLYLIGTIMVTVVFNVPRNNALDRVEPESGEAEIIWATYLKEWTFWNHIRTVACILSLTSFILAMR